MKQEKKLDTSVVEKRMSTGQCTGVDCRRAKQTEDLENSRWWEDALVK